MKENETQAAELFIEVAPFAKGDLIIADDHLIYDIKTGETVRDVMGGRVAVCSMTPSPRIEIQDDGRVKFKWYWSHPLDIIPVHFYRKATKAEVENELIDVDKDIENLKSRKELLLKRLEDM